MVLKIPKTLTRSLGAAAEESAAGAKQTTVPRALTAPPELKALPQAPSVSERELYFNPSGGASWEPDSVLRILAHEWRGSAELLPWTPAQLKSRLGRSLDVPPEVLGRAAQKLSAQPQELEAYLSSRPWDLGLRRPPPTVKDLEQNRQVLRSSGLPAGGETFEVTRKLDLDEMLQKSGLSSEQLNLMMLNSRGIHEVGEFLARAPKVNGDHVGQDRWAGYTLGLTDLGNLASLRFSYGTQFRFWSHGYERDLLGVRAQADNVLPQTDRYMSLITASDEPIAFLVPPDALHPGRPSTTGDELRWLLANPQRMRNVHFVFGAYDQG